MFQPDSIDELKTWWSTQVDQQVPIRWRHRWRSADSTERANRDLSITQLNRVIDYPHRDMTVTVQTGMTVAELDQILKGHHQVLPIDVPEPDRMTIAEMICGNWFGSRCAGHGTLRDWLLGVTAIDGRGRIIHSGGRVVKNVAGYDVQKFLIGSRGELAIPLEASFKVIPVPEAYLNCVYQTDDFSLLQEAWQALRNLPFDFNIFDLTSSGLLEISVSGLPQSNKALKDQIQSTLTSFAEMNAIQFADNTNEIDSWKTLLESITHPQDRYFAIRVGVRPSQTVEVLKLAADCGLIAIGHASQGVIVVTGSLNVVTSVQNKLLIQLSELNANVECLESSKSLYDLIHKNFEQTKLSPLSEKIRNVFDPQRLLKSNAVMVEG
ncbi:FAD-binding oxidoreductase [Rubinisphaera italica]|uniref:Putative FAD-linked oxidoreductase n=1 Tax=Rubinisphaera italica TaxID=2527969 RepID=A0A5C5XDQ7_9PLAN|nr:FAD-binding oxidoreductase [Rubinisphaera italica]TWT60255.1 putative FAD-linked oxidoreductase [Rubinisphaera italica]